MNADPKTVPVHRFVYAGIALIAAAGALLSLLALRLDHYPEGLSRLFPTLCLGAMAIAAVLASRAAVRDAVGADAAVPEIARLIRIAVLALLYVALLPLTGFAPATLLFQFAVLRFVFGMRGVSSVAYPLALTALALALFSGLLDVPLPQGRGWFYLLNTAWSG